MQCYKCKRNTTTSLKVSVRVYREGRHEPVNGCFGEWKTTDVPFCNRHKQGAPVYAKSIGHLIAV